MDTKKLGQLALVVLGLLVGIYATVSILHNPTGGISGLSKLITITGVILGLVNPRAGLYFLAAQVLYSDEIKRFAVYYGVTSQLTISEVLIGPLLSLCAINASFLYGVLRGHYSLGRLGWVLYALVPVFALASLASKSGESGGALSIYGTATFALYLSLIPISYGLFRELSDWVKYISWQSVLAAPAAAWGIWQYYNGFNNLEWTYALSGLSPAHSFSMLQTEDPRIFGLFGNTAQLSCVGIYGVFCVWRAFRIKKSRVGYAFLSIIFLATAFYSQSRGMLLFPFIAGICVLMFRRKSTTLLLYFGSVSAFIVGVWSSTYMLQEGITKGNELIAMEGKWGTTLTLNTLSDRLMGWERLRKASSWSWFGNKSEVASAAAAGEGYNHDSINKILLNYGAVGLVSAILFGAVFLYIVHSSVSRSTDKQLRYDGALILGCVVPALLMSITLGDNLNASVVSFQLWSVFAGIFVVRRISETQKASVLQNLPHVQPSQTIPPRMSRPVRPTV